MKGRILIVDDDRNLRLTLAEILRSCHFDVLESENSTDALKTIQEMNPDLVFCDWRMPGGGGEELLRDLQEHQRIQRLPVIVMTAYGNSGNAIKAIQLGAYDFISKPFDLDEISATAERALEHARLQTEVENLRDTVHKSQDWGRGDIVGSSSAMLQVFKDIGRVAASDSAVLIQGESGTGKELVARAIHKNSRRSGRAFVAVNCAALPGELLESELFGHERGAFTGAIARKPGRFEAANGGTIFLDEIGELPISLQPKLLRVLQERAFERLGGNETIQSDFRIVAATNCDLERLLSSGDFRQDLYYRLNAFTINLPPLRDRRSDIAALAEHFREVYASRNKVEGGSFSEDALVALQQYSYPGNVRELEHIIERALLQAQGRLILPEHLQLQKVANKNDHWIDNLTALPLHASVEEWEKFRISKTLEETGGNKAEAARRLGIHRRLLYEKLKRFGLAIDDKEQGSDN
ncbi:MAG: sigma-54 dependent transcriptional regulator [Candidatus Sulfotelmatobacter sp.]